MDQTLAVVSQSGESLSFFDISTGRQNFVLSDLTSEPHELSFDKGRNLLYVSHAYRHGWYPEHGDFCPEISVVDCKDKTVTDIIRVDPAKGVHYLALDQEHDILYASVEAGLSSEPNSGGIVGICLKTRRVIKRIESGYKTHWFVLTPDGSKAFTCNKEADFVSVIDLIDEKLAGKISMPGGCEQPGISTNGRLAFFPTPTISACLSEERVTYAVKVIDTVQNSVIRTIPMDLPMHTIHVNSKDQLLIGQFQISGNASGLARVNLNGKLRVLGPETESFKEIGATEVGVAPLTVLSSPDGTRAFVSNILSGTVTIVDTTKMVVERTLEVDTVQRADKKLHQGAHGLALIP